ncbi:MAG: hypothetical protein DWQ04_09535 [Chloroflexi bacterium]|nr:MAG: hypothetical protein DWQ04_09535 [Chloroflexota bacterium]
MSYAQSQKLKKLAYPQQTPQSPQETNGINLKAAYATLITAYERNNRYKQKNQERPFTEKFQERQNE